MLHPKRMVLAMAVAAGIHGLAWGYGSAFQDAPPAESPAYGRGYGYGESQGGRNRSIMENYSAAKKGTHTGGKSGSMGGSSSGGR